MRKTGLAGDGQGVLTLIDLRSSETLNRIEALVPARRPTGSGGVGFGWGGVVAVGAARSGSLLWSFGATGDVAVWDRSSIRRFETAVEAPAVGVVSDDGEVVAVGGGDGVLSVIRIDSGEALTLSSGELSAAFLDVALGPDSRTALSSHVDGSVLFWDLRDHGAELIVPPGAGTEATVMNWETGKPDALSSTQAVVRAPGVAISRDGAILLAAFSDGWLHVWSGQDRRLVTSFHGDESLLCCAIDGELIAAGGSRGVHLLQLHFTSAEPEGGKSSTT